MLQFAQLLLRMNEFLLQFSDFSLQPLNVRRTSLLGGKRVAMRLRRGQRFGKLPPAQHLAVGAREFHVPNFHAYPQRTYTAELRFDL
jgi:hypothetical protein